MNIINELTTYIREQDERLERAEQNIHLLEGMLEEMDADLRSLRDGKEVKEPTIVTLEDDERIDEAFGIEPDDEDALNLYKAAAARRKESKAAPATPSLFAGEQAERIRKPFTKVNGNKRWRDRERAALIRIVKDSDENGIKVDYNALQAILPSRTRPALIMQVSYIRRALR